ncbi:MAG: PIG-L deacetylase family protein [Candidatus Woesearchaeota archaeon]
MKNKSTESIEKKKESIESNKKPETVLTFCAHNDDQLLGAGGTLAKYAKEGKIFKTYVFSFGESSHPWLKDKLSAQMRIKEAKKAEKVLGGNDIYFFGLKEGDFLKKEKRIKKRIKQLIEENNPTKIFTHSIDDPHRDHKVVFKMIMQIIEEIRFKGDVYSFNIWNPINVRKRQEPKMFVDTSSTFKKKLEAFKAHKSQKMTFLTLWWDIWRRDRLNGFFNRCKYAEIFFKVR